MVSVSLRTLSTYRRTSELARAVVWTVNSTVAINDVLRTSVVDAVTTNFPLKAIALRSTLADERK